VILHGDFVKRDGTHNKEYVMPNPGSDEAIAQGCTCPVLDNAHGRGAWGSSGEDAVFWMNADCPLHGGEA